MRRLPWLLPLLLLTGLALLSIDKPVHLDDTNFLALARGAAADPWRPHAIHINWQGRSEPAFDVLSNPPGVAWWLAPVLGAPVWALRLWMLPWLLPAVWGATALGQRLAGRGRAAALLVVGAPIAVWATAALTPDLPLLAVTLAGFAGLICSARPLAARWPWALLVGAAALFRYSGLALIPVVALWPWLQGERRAALKLGAVAALPAAGLFAHDLLAYGDSHLLAMVGFQSVSGTPRDLFRKGAALVAMLGGAGVLPILAAASPRRAGLGAAAGLGLGLAAVWVSAQQGGAALGTLLACSAGGASLGGALKGRDPIDRFLVSWAALGLVFLLSLRFAATRYWLPFLPPLVLLPLRRAGPGLVRAAVAATLLLAALLARDDRRLALAQQALAARVLEAAGGETGLFAGHWGWQFHLEAAGWAALEEDSLVPPGALLAVSEAAWPQEPAPGCLEKQRAWEIREEGAGPRVLTAEGAANLHAFLLSGRPPVESYAPWGFGGDPLDRASLWRGCEVSADFP